MQRSASLPRSVPAWLVALAVGVVALVPRVWGLGDFFTIDEPYHWIGRVQRFAVALAERDWAATNQTGHPGVTTMWLGALGQWLGHQFDIYYFGWTGGGTDYLAVMRLPVAIVNSLAIVVGYTLLRRLLRADAALLAALLWATSPFLVAHGRLLHLDGLATSFMILSVLLLLITTNDTTNDERRTTPPLALSPGHPSQRWALVASGICAGFAFLTKAPSLILLPFVGLLLFAPPIIQRLKQRHLPSTQYLAPATQYLLWLSAAMLVVVVLWPALWVAPGAALGAVYKEITANGGEPHHSGNYFLGYPTADPGPLFYPAVILWRTTPVTLLGLIAFVGFTIYDLRFTIGALHIHRIQRFTLLSLASFVLLFTVIMSLEPKKFDRYLLPVWPALEILAACGWVRIFDYRRRAALRPSSFVVRPLSFVVCCLFLAGTLAVYHPYYLAYFNPLLGGSATGQRVLLVGWGEGLEQAGAWLRARPDVARAPVLSWIPPTLAPFVPREVLVRDLRPQYVEERSSYVVLYSRSVQRKESAVAEEAVRKTPALFTVRMHGIEYASVHQLPRPFATPRDTLFGEGLRLRGFTAAQLGSTLVVTPSWDVQRDQPGGVNVFIHVLDAQGSLVAQADDLLDKGMFQSWQAGQQFDEPLHIQNLPPGAYRVVLGVYQPTTGARLPIRTGDPLPGDVDGPDALLLTMWEQR